MSLVIGKTIGKGGQSEVGKYPAIIHTIGYLAQMESIPFASFLKLWRMCISLT